ncbi:MerR family transcriptional regulator [Salidesulfovibrio brasiliensis]|uniref:MerR family transcriptional regulator n=1 Tax=Salidesulfovibrio brasiliensis TaxID=221711 RepID=UPI0006D07E5D|nr:MerR family transcriptional regulator [Salidesulfovibrio brasiliensis]
MTTVGRLAARYGLSRSTLLYYERIGLLSPAGHARGDYRHYGPEEERRLKRILDYRSAGVPLREIGRILDAPEENRVTEVLETRLTELRAEMETLANQQRVIAGLLGRPELLERQQSMDKATWTRLLEAAGFTDEDMRRWHEDFERTAPDKHERFLRFLHIPDDEIALIRRWSKAPHKILNMKHATDAYMELFFKLYEGVERKGPGEREATARALELCGPLPENPQIIDIGCGSGLGSVYLAELTGGYITAVEYHDVYVKEAETMAERHGQSGRIAAMQGDMAALPFDDESFDLVWSEGAAYIMGFDKALKEWKRLVRPGGCLVVSEAVWLTDTPPAEVKAYWNESYPDMRTPEGNIAAAEGLGYTVRGTFLLPEHCWTQFYDALGRHLDEIEDEFLANPGAKPIVDETRHEAELWRKHPNCYGYQYYVLRKS